MARRRIRQTAIVMVLAAATALLWYADARADAVGSVSALEGHADVLHPGARDWIPLATGDVIGLADQLRTLDDGKLKLVFRDDTVLTLAPNSQLAITDQVVGAAPVSRFSLLLGTVRAVVTDRYAKPGSRFEVQTPTAIAGVRGTGFLARYDQTQEETLIVGLFDTTTVRALSDQAAAHVVDLGPGDMTRVLRGRFPLNPAPVPEGVLRSLNAATAVVPGAPERQMGPGGKSAPGAASPGKATSGGAPPEATIDQPVDLLKRKHGVPPPPPPPPPRGG